jgi:hypothetical protein
MLSPGFKLCYSADAKAKKRQRNISMIGFLCKILRPACVIATLLVMVLLVTYFWGFEFLSGTNISRILISYAVLLIGSFVVFYIDDPDSLRRRR